MYLNLTANNTFNAWFTKCLVKRDIPSGIYKTIGIKHMETTTRVIDLLLDQLETNKDLDKQTKSKYEAMAIIYAEIMLDQHYGR